MLSTHEPAVEEPSGATPGKRRAARAAEEAEQNLRAIRAGEGEAVVKEKELDTLKGTETSYRVLIESMNEGAATLAPDGTILYCNRRFAEMVATPAEQVTGSSLGKCVAPTQQQIVRALVNTAQYGGARAELSFSVPDGPGLSVLLSLWPIHSDSDTIGVVAADLSERKAFEEKLLRAHDSLEQQVKERTAELRTTNEELNRFNEARVGRELRMIELKKEVNSLYARLGQPPRFAAELDEEARPGES